MKRLLFILLGSFIFFYPAFTQTLLSGVMNYYMQVQAISPGEDTVYYGDPDHSEGYFKPGDKVLMIQLTGILFENDGIRTDYENGVINYKNCGKYEVVEIGEIDTVNQYIIFTANELINNYDNDEKIQLVRLIEEDNAIVNADLSAKDWDGNTGGIVAMIINDTLTLNANINAAGKGFRGALPEMGYTGSCRSITGDTVNFLPAELNRAGNKGEGNVSVSFPFTKGVFPAGNGGGGGNGLFAGGGGGSNYRNGGYGGFQYSKCSSFDFRAKGGNENLAVYSASGILMGGGGGSGVQAGSKIATNGGDGGGIILIIANVLKANNRWLRAYGDSVKILATASAGGGGAGGTVLLDVSTYSGNLNITVRGGKGGNTDSTGSGGGGNGGVIRLPGSTLPNGTIDTLRGNGGSVQVSITAGTNGEHGKAFYNYEAPLNGFLFNYIQSTDSICSGQQPGLITGSSPKGGTGSYNYLWEQSENEVDWETASGTGVTSRDFTPGNLGVTTYFRRIVGDGETTDTSKTIEIFVYNAIYNHILTGNDSICSGNSPLNISGTTPSGGDNTYLYQWQQSTNLTTWENTGNPSMVNSDLQPGPLQMTHYYRRYVTSHEVCSNISDTVVVVVLEKIENNELYTPGDTTLCENENAELFARYPVNGNGNYTYSWQENTTGEWIDVTGDDSQNLITGILNETTRYRRIVFSGNERGCVDTSASKTVNVLPSINNNFPIGGEIYTCYNHEKSINASQPDDGLQGDYSYLWQMSGDGSSWSVAGLTGNTDKDFITRPLTEPAFFRRIVYSSALNKECADTSAPVKVLINQLPTGDLISRQVTVCEGIPVYVRFNVDGEHGPLKVVAGNDVIKDSLVTSVFTDSLQLIPHVSQNFRIISISDDSMCYADITQSTGLVEVTVHNYPVANAGEDAETCGLSYTLGAVKDIQVSTGLWTASEGSFINPTSENATANISNYGTYSFNWIESNWQCSDTDYVSVTFYEQPAATDAGEDQFLDFKFQTFLNAVPPNVGQGKWTVSEGSALFENDLLYNSHVSGLDFKNTLKWTVTNGVCLPSADSMLVIVNPIKINVGFTPDDDGKNDLFRINIENAESVAITIFNRFGQIVFESDNYIDEANFWDGTRKGNELPEGTYFYVLKVKLPGKEDVFEFKKYVELVRSK